MARLETKSVSVSPREEQSTIKTYEQFGWACLGSQEILSENTHHETRGGKSYEVHSTTNYVKLTFQRDRDMENYDKIVSLENQYWSLIKSTPTMPKNGKGLIIAGCIITGITLLGLIGGAFNAAALIFLVPGIAGIVFGILKKKKVTAEFTAKSAEHNEKVRAVLEEVDPLC